MVTSALQLPQGDHQIRISYLGFQTGDLFLSLKESRRININLEPVLTLKEIVVTASIPGSQSLRQAQIPLKSLQNLPMAAGEPDLYRQLEFFPGVQPGPDGIGGLSVRGGDNDQNLVLMDDVPIYHPTHSLGVISIFNPQLVREARFHKAGIPARYSGRLSSVLDVRNREGNNQKFSGLVGIGTLASQLVLEAPIQKKGGFLFAARRTHIDPLLNWWSNKEKESAGSDRCPAICIL